MKIKKKKTSARKTISRTRNQKLKTKRLLNFSALFLLFISFVIFALSVKKESYQFLTSLNRYFYSTKSNQCVDFVKRYYQQVFGIEIGLVERAQEMFSLASNFGLFAHPNGSRIYPQPGDILVFSHPNKIGHVAIITDVKKDGVKIIEQNWVKNAITTNGNQPLLARYQKGRYFLEKRNGYAVVGWLGRENFNPTNRFAFLGENPRGWIEESGLKAFYKKERISYADWEVEVSGRNPTLLSPIFLNEVPLQYLSKKIRLIVGVTNFQSLGTGVISLRDQTGNWPASFTFQLNPSFSDKDPTQEVIIDIAALDDNFKISQIRLQLNTTPVLREKWRLRLLEIY